MTFLLAGLMAFHPVNQADERTCFQCSRPFGPDINLGTDVAISYGIDKTMPARVAQWKAQGYIVQLMTGVSWGEYQDYLFGRWDGIDHQDEAQQRQNGEKIGHGGDVYYMCPGPNYGKYLASGVTRALKAGVEAVHLEEPEFWVAAGYSPAFKREWRLAYDEPWSDPAKSDDAQWRSSKLKYFLYRRALTQVFDSVLLWNKQHGTNVQCYVPTHSLLNYSSWNIVSPESSLARIPGCNGYIAQVWTGTARTPNYFNGVHAERTFETAFLEYGAMQNLVEATGRRVWYLADPVEDNPDHDWNDYRTNWQSTLVASLLHPEVWRYEVCPWPDRVFTGQYPTPGNPSVREPIPRAYSSELLTVMGALADMKQSYVRWATPDLKCGVVVSDSLMFERAGPHPSDDALSHFYGLAMPLVKRAIPVQPVQLESADIAGYLSKFKILAMSFNGMKPLSLGPLQALAAWVKRGGSLVFVDDDSDSFNNVRDWWNDQGKNNLIPRQILFKSLGIPNEPGLYKVGKGKVLWDRENPATLARSIGGADLVMKLYKQVATSDQKRQLKGSSTFELRRGPYLVASAMNESDGKPMAPIDGTLIDLFDPNLPLLKEVALKPGDRALYIDLSKWPANRPWIAGPCRAAPDGANSWLTVGPSHTGGIALIRLASTPDSVMVGTSSVTGWSYDPAHRLLRVPIDNTGVPQKVSIQSK